MNTASCACDLCGLPVPPKPFRASADGAERLFCCEGCRTIWTMLNGDVEQTVEDNQQEQQRKMR